MTLEDAMVKRLVDNGMFEEDAKKVLASVKAEADDNATEAVHWSDQVGEVHGVLKGYPPQFIAVLAGIVTTYALKWVDENYPKAWYRPMLAGEA